MTIKEARKILGKQAENISDIDLEKDIEIAELLKNIFFDMLKGNKISRKTLPDVHDISEYGKKMCNLYKGFR